MHEVSEDRQDGLVERLAKPVAERLTNVMVNMNMALLLEFETMEADMLAAAKRIELLEKKLAFLSRANCQSIQLADQAKDALQTCICSMEGDCKEHHKIAINTADKAFVELTKVVALPTSTETTSLLKIVEQKGWSITPQVGGGWIVETSDCYGDDGQEREIARTRGSLTSALMEAVEEELPKEFEWLLVASLNQELLHVPKGWKVVPERMTQAMEDAAYDAVEAYEKAESGAWCGLSSAYDAMIAKAPAPASKLFPGVRIESSPEKKPWDAERYFAELRVQAWDTYKSVIFDAETVRPSVGQYQARNLRHLKRIYSEAREKFPEFADTLLWVLHYQGIEANRHETLSESFGVGRYIPKDDECLWTYWRDTAHKLRWSEMWLKAAIRDVVTAVSENVDVESKSVKLPLTVFDMAKRTLEDAGESIPVSGETV